MIRVLVVDDDAMVRSGLAAILAAGDGIEVVGQAGDGVDGVALAGQVNPDVVVMDVRMPRLDGIAATRELLARPGAPRILVITTFEHDSYVRDALVAGAHGFLLKRAGAQRLVEAVRTLAAGDAVLFPESIRELVATREPSRRLPDLSPRKAEVLGLLAKGMTNLEIGRELFIGTETVKTYVASLLAKLDARDRTQAVVAAYESGFVRPGD